MGGQLIYFLNNISKLGRNKRLLNLAKLKLFKTVTFRVIELIHLEIRRNDRNLDLVGRVWGCASRHNSSSEACATVLPNWEWDVG